MSQPSRKSLLDIENEIEALIKEDADLNNMLNKYPIFAYNYISHIIEAINGKTESEENLATMAVLKKLAQDIRSMQILSNKGYASQFMTLASSAVEAVYEVLVFLIDNKSLEKWVEHEVVLGRSYENHYNRISKFLTSTINDPIAKEEELQREWQLYQALCAAKHGNPVMQQSLMMDGFKETHTRVTTVPLSGSFTLGNIAVANYKITSDCFLLIKTFFDKILANILDVDVSELADQFSTKMDNLRTEMSDCMSRLMDKFDFDGEEMNKADVLNKFPQW